MEEVAFSIESRKAKLQFKPLHNAEGSWEGRNICKAKFQRDGFRRNTWQFKLCEELF